ncbi:DUF3265 domain-containing protein [Vibrio vulnificus]|nr:DUF3265 domain-containing protein [Vibrio vulnificus]MBF4499479.1 DUF3265 domain-containing protein [Vibrio vulnificus]MBL6179142.1 DUF3265 domain-containing protein [Vibrio vulnificus]HDY7983765.1 DUF3265 domain-containing protein [Vibrio vulnificus]HDY8007225.1 DUF3265 domain-containing protein [Vibrio vulnificus]
MTRRSRGIHAAWHFWYVVSFGGEGAMRKVGLGGIHPLTQRYTALTLEQSALHNKNRQKTAFNVTVEI